MSGRRTAAKLATLIAVMVAQSQPMCDFCRVQRKLIALLTLLNTFNYLDRYLVASVLPILSAELLLNNEQSGRLVAAFVVGYFLFSPLFGYLGDRLKRPWLMAAGALLWSAATIGSGLATGFWIFVLMRILVGVGEASFGTISPGYLKDQLNDPIRLNNALSIYFAAIPVGSALGYVVGGFFARHYGWQMGFYVAGAVGLLLAPLLLALPEKRRTRAQPAPLLPGLKKILGTPILGFAIGGYVFNSFALNGIAAFMTKYGVTLGFDIADINIYFGGILVVAGFFGTTCGGWAASRLARRSGAAQRTMMTFVALTAIAGAVPLGIAFAVQSQTLFLVLCFIAEILIFAGTAPVNSVIVLGAPAELVTLTQGLTIFALNLFGAFLAPIAVGLVADHFSLALGMQLCSSAMLCAGIVWWIGRGARSSKG